MYKDKGTDQTCPPKTVRLTMMHPKIARASLHSKAHCAVAWGCAASEGDIATGVYHGGEVTFDVGVNVDAVW